MISQKMQFPLQKGVSVGADWAHTAGLWERRLLAVSVEIGSGAHGAPCSHRRRHCTSSSRAAVQISIAHLGLPGFHLLLRHVCSPLNDSKGHLQAPLPLILNCEFVVVD